jgi:hypothetical protein
MKTEKTGYEVKLIVSLIFNCKSLQEAEGEQENLKNALKNQLDEHYPFRVEKVEVQPPELNQE